MVRRTITFVTASLLVVGCGNGSVNDCVTEVEESITDATTWGDMCPTVLVKDSIDVLAPLTVEPGTTVQMEQSVAIDVDGEGSLNAVGTREEKINFEGTSETPGFWGGIAIETLSEQNHLEWVTIRHAGAKGFKSKPWVLTLAGESTNPGGAILDTVTIAEGSGVGLVVQSGGELRDANAVRIAAFDGLPAQLDFPAVSGVSDDFEFEGVRDVWVKVEQGTISSEHIWPDLSVPYRLGPDLEIAAGGKLVVEAGTTLELEQNVRLETNEGAISLLGTEDAPVEVLGVERRPGYWDALIFESGDSANRVEHAIISHGGSGRSRGEEAGVIVTGDATTNGYVEMRNSTLRDIQGYGVLIFNGGLAEMEGMTFENITSGTNVEDRNPS
jgi:hypothetical protein